MFKAHALEILFFEGEEIGEVVRFADPGLFPYFELLPEVNRARLDTKLERKENPMAEDHWIDSGAQAPDSAEKLMGGPVDFYAENREPRLLHPELAGGRRGQARRAGEEDRQEAQLPGLHPGRRGLGRLRLLRRRAPAGRPHPQLRPPGRRRACD